MEIFCRRISTVPAITIENAAEIKPIIIRALMGNVRPLA
jgi:hypothetical protein